MSAYSSRLVQSCSTAITWKDEAPSSLGMQNTRRTVIWLLAVGEILSAVMVIPSLRWTGLKPASLIFHLVLFAVVSAPFAILYAALRHGWSSISVGSIAVACICLHAWVIKGIYAPGFAPQEFGYVGLVLVPFYELAIAVPIGLSAAWLIKSISKAT